MKNRVEVLKNKKRFNKLCIFPEGTTSNGHAIVGLKIGVFL